MSTMLVIGAGVAGLTCALSAAESGADVMLVTPGGFDAVTGAADELAGGNTAWAQGGIAAALGPDDAWRLHAADTIAAGAGLVDPAAAELLTKQGAAAMLRLISQGFPADRISGTSSDLAQGLSLGLEAAHSRPRIVHAGEDRTGASLHTFLTSRLRQLRDDDRITVIEHSTAVSLLTDSGAVTGALLRDAAGQLSVVRADSVVLATGGYGALYPQSTNHSGARGEGVVLAARAGAVVADLEFVQFHPTVLAGTGLLISEAVRGAGAVLRDGSGAEFMHAVHEAGDLAPRDVVSRTIHRVLRERSEAQVWLDATVVEVTQGAGTLARRFPKLTQATKAHGFDWATEPIPVAPAAHYTMGGVATDLDGRSSLPGLFVVGEASSTGVHGANRLASNSLLEGMVFGARAAIAALEFSHDAAHRRGQHTHGQHTHGQWNLRGEAMSKLVSAAERLPAFAFEDGDLQPDSHDEHTVREAVERGLGIERDAAGIREVADIAARSQGNLAHLAGMIAHAAALRTESRGAHQRSDFASTDPGQQHRNAFVLEASNIADSNEAALASTATSEHRSHTSC